MNAGKKGDCKKLACALQGCIVKGGDCASFEKAFSDCCLEKRHSPAAREGCLYVWKKQNLA